MRKIACAAIAVLATGSTAVARPTAAPPPDRPWVSVTLDADGESALIHAAIDIPAPAERVWAAMTDCKATRLMIRSLIQCRVVRAGQGWDIREHITRAGPLWPGFRYVFRSDYDPGRRIRFRRIEGNVRTLEGEWTLLPSGDGRITRVTYRTRMAADILAPPLLVRAGLRKDTPRVLETLRRLSTGE